MILEIVKIISIELRACVCMCVCVRRGGGVKFFYGLAKKTYRRYFFKKKF